MALSQKWVPYVGALVISLIVFIILIPKIYNSLLPEVMPYWGIPFVVALLVWSVSFIVIGYILKKYVPK